MDLDADDGIWNGLDMYGTIVRYAWNPSHLYGVENEGIGLGMRIGRYIPRHI